MTRSNEGPGYRGFFQICIFNFIINLSQFMTNTLLSKYAHTMGASATAAGMVAGIFSMTSLMMKPFSGPAIDAFPKKRVLLLGCGLLLAALAGYAAADSIELLIFFRLIHGLAMGINVITCLSMVSDTLPEERLTSGIAFYSVAQALASAIGPSAGLWIQERFDFRTAFTVSAALVLVSLPAAVGWKIPEKGEKRRFRISVRNCIAAEALVPTSIMMCLAAAFATINAYLVLLAEDLHVEHIGLFFTVNAIALIAGRPFFGRLCEKLGAVTTLVLTICLFAVGMLTIALAGSLPVFLLAAVLVALGYGSCQPLIQALCIRSVPPDRRGAASATSFYGSDFGYLLSPLLAGWLVDTVGYSGMFGCMAAFPLLGMGILLLFRTRLPPETAA